MRYLNLFTLLVLVACAGGGDLNNEGGAGEDTTAPSLSGSISLSDSEEAYNQSPTFTWSDATDSESSISHYEVSIASDSGDSLCNGNDFSSTLLNWTRVPSGTDNDGSGYQVVDGNLDGNNTSISLSQAGDTEYCLAVRATDESGNVSDPIYSSSTYEFSFKDCNEILTAQPMSTDGVYRIDPDQDGGDAAFDVFCDMSTQGGGWTLAIRYDRSQASGGAYALANGSGRQLINIGEMDSINAETSLSASINMIPVIENGATHLMHVGKANDGATDSTTYVRTYFSEIYQAVLDTPSNIFDSSLDTNSGDGVSGSVVSWSSTNKARWFESDFSVMTETDTDSNFYPDRIIGGEGDAMFTNGDREGAVYSSGISSGGPVGHHDPKVQWGFYGKDGTQQGYGGNTYIGTYCGSSLTSGACQPESQINLMFIR